MSRDEILELAISAACDKWAEYRFLAGFDSSISGQNYARKTKLSELTRNEEEMYEWSRKITFLQNMLAHKEDNGLYYECLAM